MQAFISYSFNNKELYLVSLLVNELKKSRFSVISHADFITNDSQIRFVNVTRNYIGRADLFIGIITKDGHETDRVMDEWRIAYKHNVPNILLVEKGIIITGNTKNNAIVFDRQRPKKAIDQLLGLRSSNAVDNIDDDLKAIATVGAVALGVAGLIALISKK